MLMRFCLVVRQSCQLSSLRSFSEFKGVSSPDDDPIISSKTSESIQFGDILPFCNSFKQLATEKRIYVDKTDILYKLVTEFQACIFTRPRLFGKSLLISTLKAIFMKDPILKELKISKHYEDLKQYPVISFDFSQNSNLIQNHIKMILDSHCTLLGIDSSKKEDLQELVVMVIEEYHRKGQSPCILIDEYDSPIWVSDSDRGKANLTLISNFFTTLKSLSKLCRFTFATGVTNIELSGLFSGPNSLYDISLNEDFSTLVGFTKEEIMHCFPVQIKRMSESNHTNMSESDVLNEMERLYNGYKFSAFTNTKVYNPVSVIRCFSGRSFKEFWSFSTQGGLSKLRKYPGFPSILSQKGEIKVDSAPINLDSPDLNKLLWQTGCFTIDSYSYGKYKLVIPNNEVRSVLNSVASNLSSSPKLSNVVKFLTEVKIKEVISEVSNLLFSTIPRYHIQDKREFEMNLNFLFTLSGVNPRFKVPAGTGILDITFDITSRNNKKIGYIFELTIGEPASKAIAKIKKNRYFTGMGYCHTIVLIGLSLNKVSKHIDNAEYIIIDIPLKSEIEKGGCDLVFDNEDSKMPLKLKLTKNE